MHTSVAVRVLAVASHAALPPYARADHAAAYSSTLAPLRDVDRVDSDRAAGLVFMEPGRAGRSDRNVGGTVQRDFESRRRTDACAGTVSGAKRGLRP